MSDDMFDVLKNLKPTKTHPRLRSDKDSKNCKRSMLKSVFSK